MEQSVFKKDKKIIVCNLITAVLLVVLLVTQFLPFWSCVDCKTCGEAGEPSISAYIWFPEKHKPITKDMTQVFKDHYGEDLKDEKGKAFKFNANDVAFSPVVLLVFAAAGLVLCVIKANKYIVSILPLISGAVGAWGYLTNPALMIGKNSTLHLVVCILVVVSSLVPFVLQVVKVIGEKKAKKANA